MGNTAFKTLTVVLVTLLCHMYCSSAQATCDPRCTETPRCDAVIQPGCTGQALDDCYRRSASCSTDSSSSTTSTTSTNNQTEDPRTSMYRECRESGGTKPNAANCANLYNSLAGGTNNDSECRSQSDKYNEEAGNVSVFCQGGGGYSPTRFNNNDCGRMINDCRNQIYRLGGINGTGLEAAYQYSQAMQQIGSVNPACAQAIAGRDSNKNETRRENAQKQIDDIEEKLDDMNKTALEDTQKLSEELAKMNNEAVNKTRELNRKADELDAAIRENYDKMLDDKLMLEESFKEAARAMRAEMDKLESELRKVREVMPLDINMDYETEVAKIASECLAKGRADATARQAEKEKKKAGQRFSVLNLNDLTNSQTRGNAQQRFLADKRHAERLCLQDKAPMLDALKTKKAMKLKLAADQEQNILNAQKLLEIKMQDLVKSAEKQDDAKARRAASAYIALVKTKQSVLDEAVYLQQFAYFRGQQLQQENFQKAQMMQQMMWQLDNKKREANLTLIYIPQLNADREDYTVFQDALKSYNNLPNMSGRGDVCCAQGARYSRNAFCRPPGRQGESYNGGSRPSWMPTWGNQ